MDLSRSSTGKKHGSKNHDHLEVRKLVHLDLRIRGNLGKSQPIDQPGMKSSLVPTPHSGRTAV